MTQKQKGDQYWGDTPNIFLVEKWPRRYFFVIYLVE